MDNLLSPQTPEELAEAVGAANSRGEPIALAGAGSKRQMGGPAAPGLGITTAGLRCIRQYEPRDLTISVEAGLPWCELDRLLAENRQMIPLDPPFFNQATVGGVIAANSSGPRRKLYGTARDFVIGMQFATIGGKLVSSGAMVVKNVAGLDMAKLLTGSFGTLAAITSVNFKLVPRPACERTFLIPFETAASAAAARDFILKSPLQPAALDILTPPAAAELGASGFALVMEAAGNPAVIGRYEREIASLGPAAAFDGAAQETLWRNIRDFVPRFLASQPDGAVARVSSTLKDVARVLDAAPGPAIARAGSGVCYICFDDPGRAAAFAAESARQDCKAVVEFAPEARKAALDLWPSPGSDFDLMTRVKRLFDPKGLLNRGRMYGRI